MPNTNTTLHAAYENLKLSIWAQQPLERHQQEGPRPHPHPHALPGQVVKDLLTNVGILTEPPEHGVWSNIAHLPSRVTGPKGPNDPYQEDDTIAPWRLESYVTHPSEAIKLLLNMAHAEARLLERNVTLAPDARFWIQAANFARSILVRQRFLPSFEQSERRRRPTWVPVLTGVDHATFRSLAHVMPAAARCLRSNPRREDQAPAVHHTSHQTLLAFLTDVVDDVVRPIAATTMTPPPVVHQDGKARHSLHDSWLQGLVKVPKPFRRHENESRQMPTFLDDWHAPLNPRPNVAHQLGFMLSPDENGDTYRIVTVLHHLHVTDAPHTPISNVWNISPLSTLNPTEVDQARRATLVALNEAVQASPAVANGIRHGLITNIPLDEHDAQQFLETDLPALRKAGFGAGREPDYERDHGAPKPAAALPSPPPLNLTPHQEGISYQPRRMAAPSAAEVFENWWARRVHAELGRVAHQQIVRDAKLLAQHGRVMRINQEGNIITANVKEEGNEIFRASLEHLPMPNAIRREITSAMAERPDLMAQLTQGQLNPEVELIFSQHQGFLIPLPGRQLKMSCSCGRELCQHAAALHVAVTLHVDRHPEFLINMRGINVSHIVLHIPRTDGKQVSLRSIRYPYPSDAQAFWNGRHPTDDVVPPAAAKRPPNDAIILASLTTPSDWNSRLPAFETLAPVYDAVSRAISN